MFSSFSPKSRRFSEGADTTQRDWLLLIFLSTLVRTANRQTLKVCNGLRALVNEILIFMLTDEDRLSKRKSIGETISLQGEVESRNSPEKEEVKIRHPTEYNVFYLGFMNNFLRFLLVLFQRTPAEAITFETLKNAIGMTEELFFSLSIY